MYHLNDQNVTRISKALGRSPIVIQRNLFKTRAEWDEWYEVMVMNGEL